MEIAEFLLARIAEDEHEARFWTCDCAIEGLPLRHGLRCEERVKAECEAKRRIVERHETVPVTPGGREFTCLEDGSTTWPCPTMRLLALPYADHPDYDEAWRP